MTNEEKARKIATTNHDEYIDKKDSLHSLAICEKSALEMAEWKDHQFKEYLEKKEGLFNSNCLSVEPYIDFIGEIINELFPNEEKADYSDNDE